MSRKVRVAVICDFVEDGWHSMDLVAQMLLAKLNQEHGDRFQAERVCPPMKFRMTALPLIGPTHAARKADQAWNRFRDYPRRVRRIARDFDLFHIVDHTYGHLVHELPAERTLVTCHDLDAFRCLLQPADDPRSGLFRALARRVLSGFRKAALIPCDSNAIREEVLLYGLVPAARLRLIPNGVHPSCTVEPDPVADAEAGRLLGPASPQAIDILHVGTTIPRKRIETLLRVFAGIRERLPQARLIRAGGPFTPAQADLAQSLGLNGSVVVLPRLERPVLASVYRRSSVLLLPSSAEGFGLPLAEAMACGKPVVASDLPVLHEVGGKAALYCPVDDVPAWTARSLELLAQRQDADRWSALRAAALARARNFSWSAYTDAVAQLYQEVLETSLRRD